MALPEAQVRGNALVINEVGINPDGDRVRKSAVGEHVY